MVGIIGAIVATATAFPFALVIFFGMVPTFFAADYFEIKAAKAAYKSVLCDSTFSGKIGSVIKCLKSIRACDAGDWVGTDTDALFGGVARSHFGKFFWSSLVEQYMIGMGCVYNLVISTPLGIQVLRGKTLLGTFQQVMGSAMAMIAPLQQLGTMMGNTLQFSGALMIVSDMMDDSLNEEPPSASDQSSGDKIELTPLKNRVNMSGIKFRYGPKLPDVLEDVDASFDKGTYNVLMGESGSGKSTVLNLLMRFYKPYEGNVVWDGTDIFSTSLKSFRKQVSVMFQETMIYQGTVRDNILFGAPDAPGAVEKAARDAEIHDVIERLPDGYDTVIGGDALLDLSGGQQQRIW